MSIADIPQESSYTRPVETVQSSSINDAQEMQTSTASQTEVNNGKKSNDADDIELTGIYCITLYD